MEKVVGKVFAEDDDEIGLPLFEYVVDAAVVADILDDGEIGTGVDALSDTLCLYIARRVVYGHFRILHFVGDGESEEYNLYDGHDEYNEHRASVAQDVQKLLDNK
jgi:hypothetical protein